MATARDDSIPEFHGDVAGYRDWRRSVLIKHGGAKDEARALTAVRVLGALRGEAWAATRHLDPELLRARGVDGLDDLWRILDPLFAWQPESVLFEAMMGYLFLPPRAAGETIAKLLSRYCTALSTFLDILNQHSS